VARVVAVAGEMTAEEVAEAATVVNRK